MNNKQTAVEWLIEQLTENGIRHLDLAEDIIQQALQMEREQVSNESINSFITDMMENNPTKLVQYCLLEIGKDIQKSNVDKFTFSQEADLEEGKRFKITVEGTIEEILT